MPARPPQALDFAALQPWVRYAEHEFWRYPMEPRRIFDHEFIYLLKGGVRVVYGEREAQLKPGDLWVIEPGIVNAGVPDPEGAEIYGVHFDFVTRADSARLRYPLREENAFPRLRPRPQFPGGLVLGGVYRTEVLPDLRTSFARLFEAFHDRRANRILRVRACWLELFARLVQSLSARRLATAGASGQRGPDGGGSAGGSLAKHRDKVELAARYLEAHFAEPLDREALAARVDLSPTHLTHLFKRLTGRSPIEQLQHLRMTEAKKQLREQRLKVREIARRVGYADPYHFSRAFRRHEGLSPRAYVESLRHR